MKKFLFASSILIGIILISCGGGSDNAEIARLREENQALREQLNGNSSTSEIETVIEDTPQISGPTGTYEFTDAAGQKWTLKINSDETATLENNGQTYYGNWDIIDNHPNTSFQELPKIKFPDSYYLDSQFMDIDLENGYLYGASHENTIKAKNPRKRLEIKKIN